MAPVVNGRVIFNSIPAAYIEPGKTLIVDKSETIDLEKAPLNGGILLKTVILSVDPYMRSLMNAPDPKKGLLHTYTPGQPLAGLGIAEVIRTETDEAKVGDHVYGFLPFQNYLVLPTLSAGVTPFKILENKLNLPWTYFVGVLGMTGQTAYMAWKEFANAKEGETAFVSSGAGAVGSIVIQIAKKQGLKVIASAGSEDKLEYMKSLGADVIFNYKTTKAAEILGREGPIDIYWDNVGGETLDAALMAANFKARFIECGLMASFGGKPAPIQNFEQTIGKNITIHGFTLTPIHPKYEKEFYETWPELVAKGEIAHKEHLFHGLEGVEQGVISFQDGSNVGKAVIVL
ncbi:hypothetical protein MD484_g6538, partial [Candolleomyces efflorescens]